MFFLLFFTWRPCNQFNEHFGHYFNCLLPCTFIPDMFLGFFFFCVCLLFFFNLAFGCDRKFCQLQLENLFIALPATGLTFWFGSANKARRRHFIVVPGTAFSSVTSHLPCIPFLISLIWFFSFPFFFKGKAFTLLFDFYSGSVCPAPLFMSYCLMDCGFNAN